MKAAPLALKAHLRSVSKLSVGVQTDGAYTGRLSRLSPVLGETDPAGAGPVRAKEWARERGRVRVAPSDWYRCSRRPAGDASKMRIIAQHYASHSEAATAACGIAVYTPVGAESALLRLEPLTSRLRCATARQAILSPWPRGEAKQTPWD